MAQVMEIYIAVIGPTLAGKSEFIRLCTGEDNPVDRGTEVGK
jgi:hypothetical protein